MRSMFTAGIRSSKETAWMGQVATTSTGTNTWGSDIAKGIDAGSKAFITYEQEQIAEENRKAAQAAAEAAASAARTAQIQQQTAGMQINAGTKIMGLDKPVFYLGAAVILAAVIGGGFILMKGK
jgi:hypothetical protein